MDYSKARTLKELVDMVRQHREQTEDRASQQRHAHDIHALNQLRRKMRRVLPLNVQTLLGARALITYICTLRRREVDEWSYMGDRPAIELHYNDKRYLLINKEVQDPNTIRNVRVDLWALVYENKVVLEFDRNQDFIAQLISYLEAH